MNMKYQSGIEVGEHCRGVDETICLAEVSCTPMNYTRICWWVFDFLFVHVFADDLWRRVFPVFSLISA